MPWTPWSMEIERVRVRALAILALTAGALVQPAIAPSATVATCGVEPQWRFSTTGAGGLEPITTAFLGTVLGPVGGHGDDRVRVSVDERLAGRGPGRREVVLDGRPMCGPRRLQPDTSYLFAVSLRQDGTATEVMPFEARDGRWEYAFIPARVGSRMSRLDGRRPPTDLAALVTFLRDDIDRNARRLRSAVAALGIAGSEPRPLQDPSDGLWAQVLPSDTGGSRLLVGGLDGSAWEPIASPGPIRISGPAAGRVLAQHVDGDRTVVDLVDVRAGTVRRVAEAIADDAVVALHPSGTAWFWIRPVRYGWELWGASTGAGAQPVRLTGPLLADGPRLVVSLDGRRVVVDAPKDSAPAWMLDLIAARLSAVPLPEGAALLPEMGRRALFSLTSAPDGSVGFPLVDIDPFTGRTRVLAETGTMPVRITQALDPPSFTWRETVDGESRLHLNAVWLPEDRLDPLPSDAGDLVADDDQQGVEAPGWYPLLPGGAAYDPDATGPRFAVSHDQGTVMELPPIEVVPGPSAAPS